MPGLKSSPLGFQLKRKRHKVKEDRGELAIQFVRALQTEHVISFTWRSWEAHSYWNFPMHGLTEISCATCWRLSLEHASSCLIYCCTSSSSYQMHILLPDVKKRFRNPTQDLRDATIPSCMTHTCDFKKWWVLHSLNSDHEAFLVLSLERKRTERKKENKFLSYHLPFSTLRKRLLVWLQNRSTGCVVNPRTKLNCRMHFSTQSLNLLQFVCVYLPDDYFLIVYAKQTGIFKIKNISFM